MKIQADFECGGGKRITRLGGLHWRLEAPGDASGYSKYFCVRITPDQGEAGSVLRLDIHADADLGRNGAEYFSAHFPATLWHCRGEWGRWLSFPDAAGNSVVFHGDWIETHIAVTSETGIYFATNPPLRYSDLTAWSERLGRQHGDRLRVGSVGSSAEGHTITVMFVPGRNRGLPRFLVLAGQHPSEHGGCVAAQGIAEYLLSPIKEAREMTDRFDFAIIPLMNPDGNVRGLAGANAEDIDLAEDFTGAAGGIVPRATENRLFWRWLQSEFTPAVMLDLHSGLGRAANEAPLYDGAALFVKNPEKLYGDPRRLATYRALQERFRFDTPSGPAPEDGELLESKYVEHNAAAAFGTLAVLYHVNGNMIGPREQFRRGPNILTAMVKALLCDTDILPPSRSIPTDKSCS